jgi:WD40 repeat protein
VHFLSNEILASASADRTVKLWDLRQTSEPVSTINMENPVEDFCVADRLPGQQFYVAHGNVVSLASYSNESLEL